MVETVEPRNEPTLLTIAGFDPSSGAGITADLAVFAAHGFFGTAAITAITVQSTLGVFGVHATAPHVLAATLLRLEQDLPPAAIKIGMLVDAGHVSAVADYIRSVRSCGIPVVLDPVLRSSSGVELLDAAGRRALLHDLLPLVSVVTPNSEELALILGDTMPGGGNVEDQARTLQASLPGLAVLVTGGHMDPPDDLLLLDGRSTWFPGERIESRATHGTGCAFSSALACGLAGNLSLQDAAGTAKQYVATAIRSAVPRGRGWGPLNLLWPLHGPPATT